MTLEQKIEVLKWAKKLTFFKGVSPWILSKNRTVSYRCFSQKLCLKRSFLILWKEKNDFKRKKDIFYKGLVHGLCPEIKLFLMSFFYGNYIKKDRF